MKTEQCGFLNWVKDHKKELAIISGACAVTFGMVLVVKNKRAVKGLLKMTRTVTPNIRKSESTVEKPAVSLISRDILDNLTGRSLTARALGEKALCSAQTINKRIVAAGLAEKHPSGGYVMTEAGRLLGRGTWKTTAAGYSFSNIEWDEKILDVIFNAKELQDIAAKRERARQIFAA